MQALTLTDVVVEATVTALLLAFALQAHKRFGTLDPESSPSSRAEAARRWISACLAVSPLLAAAALARASPAAASRRPVAGRAWPSTAAVAVDRCCSSSIADQRARCVYWFGGWRPAARHRASVSTSRSIRSAPGWRCLAALLVTAAMIFSWRYFDAGRPPTSTR